MTVKRESYIGLKKLRKQGNIHPTRDLSVGCHVPLSQEEDQLLLGKLRVHFGKRQHVKGKVPRRILRVKRKRERHSIVSLKVCFKVSWNKVLMPTIDFVSDE